MTTYRLNLEAAQFPLLSYYFGPSVVIRTKSDNDYIVTDAYTGNAIANAEVGIAQPLYMHNVMPSSYGYESVGYRTEVRPAAGLAATGAYNRITLLRNRAEQRHYMSTAGLPLTHLLQLGTLMGLLTCASSMRVFTNTTLRRAHSSLLP